MRSISILLPSFNEEAQLARTIEEIPRHIPEHYNYKLLFVDDGSTDGSWEILSRAAAEDSHIQALRFSRNFGKESALVAGLLAAEGDAVIIMDCDLQHPPRYIPELLRYWEMGYQVVEGVKGERQKEVKLKRWGANIFYKLFRSLTGVDLVNASDFKLLDRQVVEVWREMPERANFFRAQAAWVGFKRKSIIFEVDERTTGHSGWSLSKLVGLALSGLTGFSAKPLLLIAFVGLSFLLAFVITGIVTLVHLGQGRTVSPFIGLSLLIILTGGLLLLSLGLVGIYLERIFAEVKGRPRYIVADRLGFAATDGKDRSTKFSPGD